MFIICARIEMYLKKNGIHAMQGWKATTKDGVTRKKKKVKMKSI